MATMDHNDHHLNILHFPGQNLHYQRHPPQSSPSPSLDEQESTPIDTHTPSHRRVHHRADIPSILTTIVIPPTTTTTTTSSTTTFPDSTVPTSTASTIIAAPTLTLATATTAPKINSQSTTHSTTASRHEIILLALGIFILVAQLALIIWVGVRRRRFSLRSSSSAASGSTCAYRHSCWHRENCPRELNGLQLDGRGSHGYAYGYGHGRGHGHEHKGKGKKCLWKEAFGEDPTSPGGWRTRRERRTSRSWGLRDGEEDVEGEGEGEREDGEVEGSGSGTGSGTGSGFDDDDMGENEDAGEGVGEGIRSRGNSVVIASAHELVERVRRRSNSLGTFFKRIGAGKGEHVEEIPEEQQKTATRKRSNTFTMELMRRISTGGAGDAGLRERKGSAAGTTAREGDVEMGVGKTSGLSTDFGGKFDGIEERDGGGGSEKRRGSWVQVLRGYSGLENQNGVQDPEKGGYRY